MIENVFPPYQIGIRIDIASPLAAQRRPVSAHDAPGTPQTPSPQPGRGAGTDLHHAGYYPALPRHAPRRPARPAAPATPAARRRHVPGRAPISASGPSGAPAGLVPRPLHGILIHDHSWPAVVAGAAGVSATAAAARARARRGYLEFVGFCWNGFCSDDRCACRQRSERRLGSASDSNSFSLSLSLSLSLSDMSKATGARLVGTCVGDSLLLLVSLFFESSFFIFSYKGCMGSPLICSMWYVPKCLNPKSAQNIWMDY